ncbi:putative papain-like cysteine peptidase superfamily [Helianthus annuus]|nr:putative papain-like cysteine peptidase superfamily [Helianthus annuus]
MEELINHLQKVGLEKMDEGQVIDQHAKKFEFTKGKDRFKVDELRVHETPEAIIEVLKANPGPSGKQFPMFAACLIVTELFNNCPLSTRCTPEDPCHNEDIVDDNNPRHAIVIIGLYTHVDNPQRPEVYSILIRNSYRKTWGIEGDMWIDMSFICGVCEPMCFEDAKIG